MFRKLTYLMMLILIGVGSAFGQTTHNMSETWSTSDGLASLVTIDKNLLQYKAENTLGTVNIKINGTSYITFETAVAAITEQFKTSTTTSFPTNNVTGTTVVNLSSTTATLIANRSISGTLVVVGSGKLTANASGLITVSGSLILQGDVTLDGGGVSRTNAFISGGGKLYMAENAKIQNCINISTTNLGGAVFLNGSNAKFYMAGGVIGDETATMVGTELPVMLEGYDDYTNCYWGYALSTGNKGNKAWMGGGVYLYGGASMFMNGGHISGNEATFDVQEGWGTECGGGGVFSNLSTVTIYGGEISYNLAIAGAGIHSCRPYSTTGSSKATLNIYGGTFKWNCAATGLYKLPKF